MYYPVITHVEKFCHWITLLILSWLLKANKLRFFKRREINIQKMTAGIMYSRM